uniref:Uncharacterized protein n=2 Tax=Oryza sativa subsp. japonica TaxID=39947 RepID=Q6AUY3_ORYSJ|nr:hypothetical protein [Oryza sativa Japonica Group]ABF97518.1 hypothetical protein LOC_Os03g40760 [Oryza sativa Japonica Group]
MKSLRLTSPAGNMLVSPIISFSNVSRSTPSTVGASVGLSQEMVVVVDGGAAGESKVSSLRMPTSSLQSSQPTTTSGMRKDTEEVGEGGEMVLADVSKGRPAPTRGPHTSASQRGRAHGGHGPDVPRVRVHHVDGPDRPRPIGRLGTAGRRGLASAHTKLAAAAAGTEATAVHGPGGHRRRRHGVRKHGRRPAKGNKREGRGVLTEGGDGETTTERRPAAERMAAVGTGGDKNGVPMTPDHGGATAEGRWDAANAVEAVARREVDGDGGKRRPVGGS